MKRLLLLPLLFFAVEAAAEVSNGEFKDDLFHKPLDGEITTHGGNANISFIGDTAKAMFINMPDNSIVHDGCSRGSIVTKTIKGLYCTFDGKDFYECQVSIDLNEGNIINGQSPDDSCRRNWSEFESQRKEAKKRGYRINWKDEE